MAGLAQDAGFLCNKQHGMLRFNIKLFKFLCRYIFRNSHSLAGKSVCVL